MLAGMERGDSVEDWARLEFDPAGAPQQREVHLVFIAVNTVPHRYLMATALASS